ncbi:MAG: twin-arginine translocase TatA/TatE family subunit [Rhodanobacter sp.]
MSIWHLIILLVVVVVVFGTGKLTKIGPDLGAAIRGFKKSMDGEDETPAKPVAPETLRADPPPAAASAARETHDHTEPR